MNTVYCLDDKIEEKKSGGLLIPVWRRGKKKRKKKLRKDREKKEKKEKEKEKVKEREKGEY